MIQTILNMQQYHGNQSYLPPQNKNIGQTQKPVSGELFYGEHGENQIPDVSGINQDGAEKTNGRGADNRNNFDRYECKTCESRKYKDGSDDPGVSFKTPTNIRPENAASAVRAHEGEHVVREQAKAQREGRTVVSQSVTYHTAICPECGTPYVSGGTTRTVTKGTTMQEQLAAKFQVGIQQEEKGRYLDATA